MEQNSFKVSVTAMNDLLKKGYVVHIWTDGVNGTIGYRIEKDMRSTISPSKEFTEGLLMDMINNGTTVKNNNVDFLIYVHRDGKYGIIDNFKK